MELVENYIVDIILLGLLLLYFATGLIGSPLRMLVHVLFSVAIIYIYLYGADQFVAAMPALEQLGLEEKNTRAVSTGILLLLAMILSWLARSVVVEKRNSGFAMLLGAIFGLVRGSLVVWMLILTFAYLPKSWGEGIWERSFMLQSYSSALRTTTEALPRLASDGTYLARLEFDDTNAQPSLSDSPLAEIKESFSKKIGPLKVEDVINVESPEQKRLRIKGMDLKEMIERTAEVRALARERISAQQEGQNPESASIAPGGKRMASSTGSAYAKLKARLGGMFEEDEIVKDVSQDMQDIDKEGLTDEEVLARLKQSLAENPDGAGANLRRKVVKYLEGSTTRKQDLEEVLDKF